MEIIANENIYNIIQDFNIKIPILSGEFEKRIKEANDILFKNELRLLEAQRSKEIDDTFKNLCESNSKNIKIFDKIIKKNELGSSSVQILNQDFNDLLNLSKELENYKKFGLKIIKNSKITCFELKYDFTKLKDKEEFHLLFKENIVEIPQDEYKGNIYLIYKANNNEFKESFKIDVTENYEMLKKKMISIQMKKIFLMK